MTYSVRGYGNTGSCSTVAMGIVRISSLSHKMVKRKIAHVNACIGAQHRRHGYAGILETLEDHLQKLPLYWIHRRGFQAIDPKKVILKMTHIFLYEITTVGIHDPRTITVGAIIAIDVEPVSWNPTLRGVPCRYEGPEV